MDGVSKRPVAAQIEVMGSVSAQRMARRDLGPTAIRLVNDFILATLALAIVYFLRFRALTSLVPAPGTPEASYYWAAAFPLAGCLILVFIFTGVYRDRRPSWFVDELFAVWGATILAGLVVLAATSLYRDQLLNYSRLTFTLWLVTASLLIGAGRYVIRRKERKQLAQGVGAQRTLVVGQGRLAQLLIDRILMFPDCGYRIVGSVVRGEHPAPAGAPVLGHLDEIRQIALDYNVNAVFIADSSATQQQIAELAGILADVSADIHVVPRAADVIAHSPVAVELAGLPVFRLKRSLDRNPMQLTAKRSVDIVLSGLGLVCLSPVLLVLAVAIRITSAGPALIHQERVGLGGRPFLMHKFRSMRVDAEVSSGPVWAAPADPRRTAVGKLIRRFSLDELPQLWNVLVGEMSLVGPRPERPLFVDQFTATLPNYRERLRLRPGLTGWAQLNDLRGLTPIEQRLMYDLFYVERWSITFDLKIIITTAFRVATHKNAS